MVKQREKGKMGRVAMEDREREKERESIGWEGENKREADGGRLVLS